MTRTRSPFRRFSFPAITTVSDRVGWLARVFFDVSRRALRLVCLIRGHERVMHFERHRLSLRCLVCGQITAGWSVGEPASGRVVSLGAIHRPPMREPDALSVKFGPRDAATGNEETSARTRRASPVAPATAAGQPEPTRRQRPGVTGSDRAFAGIDDPAGGRRR